MAVYVNDVLFAQRWKRLDIAREIHKFLYNCDSSGRVTKPDMLFLGLFLSCIFFGTRWIPQTQEYMYLYYGYSILMHTVLLSRAKKCENRIGAKFNLNLSSDAIPLSIHWICYMWYSTTFLISYTKVYSMHIYMLNLWTFLVIGNMYTVV